MTRTRIGLLAVLCSGLALVGCGSEVTSARLERSVSGTFSRLLVAQQREIGLRPPSADGLRTVATCRRGADATGISGAGEDWSCVLSYSTSGGAGTVRLEVQAKPDGCWRADGGAADVGPSTLRNVSTGDSVPNPLTEFDGCFDTSVGAH